MLLDDERTRAGALAKDVEELRVRERQHEQVRRSMHFTIQELKGNVRVFVRVRPQLSVGIANRPEGVKGSEVATGCIAHEDSLSADLLGKGVEPIGLLMGAGRYDFQFDRVLAPGISQSEVFQEISMLVQSALFGRKVCVLAYGQTGSGKTHTMLGANASDWGGAAEAEDVTDGLLPDEHEAKEGSGWELPPGAGVFPRAIAQLVTAMKAEKRAAKEAAAAATATGLKKGGPRPFQLFAQLVEVYNETVRDLLHPSASSEGENGIGGAPEVAVRQHMSATPGPAAASTVPTPVPEATFYEIKSRNRAMTLLTRAMSNRRTSATRMNDVSSRSHLCMLLFTVEVVAAGSDRDPTVGCVSLADLAGSERLSRSGATGDRLKETQSINKSLSALGDVVDARRKESAHVPYRNSKLTHLLQPTLSGQVLMVAGVSPDESSAGETLCTLRFAEKANGTSVGGSSSRKEAPL